MEENYRTLIAGFLAGVLGWLEPIAADCFTLIYIFVMNAVFGYLADKWAYNGEFSIRKAWRCIIEAAIFFVVVLSIYLIGDLKDMQAGAVQCVGTLVYVVIYFYALNITRNIKSFLRKGTPAYMVVSFLYYLLSFEIIKKIPLLNDFLLKEDRESGKPEAGVLPQQERSDETS